MFEHFILGTQVNPSGPNDVDISPTQTPEPELPQLQPELPPDIPGASSSAHASGIPLNPIPKPARISVDSVVHELSRQGLRLEDLRMATPPRLPSPPGAAPDIIVAQPPVACPHPELEVDPEPQSFSPYILPRTDPPTPPQHEEASSMPPPSLLSITESAPLPPSLHMESRLRRQLNAQFHNSPLNTRNIHSLVEGMISSGDQCNVYLPPPPTTLTPLPDAGDCIMEGQGSGTLEVDEAMCSGSDEAWLENVTSLRRASGPGGIRKAAGLRYRLSAEVALRCPNVVKNRPRMRRRKKHLDSVCSGASSSAAPSAPSTPIEPLPPTSAAIPSALSL